MNLWIMAAIVVGVLAIGAVFALNTVVAQDKPANTNAGCGSCNGKCTAESNCGLATCGAANNGKCSCGG